LTKANWSIEQILKFERILFIILSDLLIIAGVLFFEFEVARMYVIYYFEFVMAFIVYSTFNLISDKRLNIVTVAMGTAGMIFITGVIIRGILGLLGFTFDSATDVILLLYPYFDIPIFLIFIIRSQILNLKEYRQYNYDLTKTELTKSLLYSFYLLVGLLIATLYSIESTLDLKISLVAGLILIRNFTEYKHYKRMKMLKLKSMLSVDNSDKPEYLH
jgi:hypothetical protein